MLTKLSLQPETTKGEVSLEQPTCLFCLDSAALLLLNEQQFYLFGQIQTYLMSNRRSAVEWYFPLLWVLSVYRSRYLFAYCCFLDAEIEQSLSGCRSHQSLSALLANFKDCRNFMLRNLTILVRYKKTFIYLFFCKKIERKVRWPKMCLKPVLNIEWKAPKTIKNV